MQKILDYLDKRIESFERDPADTNFQKGFLQALKEARRDIEEIMNVQS